MSVPVLLILLAIIGLAGVAVIVIGMSKESEPDDFDLSSLKPDEGETGEKIPGEDSLEDFFGENLLKEENNQSKSKTPDYSDVSLPFEPLNTFEPEPRQHSELTREMSRYPWPKEDQQLNAEYDDRTGSDLSSKSIHNAVEWLLAANTEAIHQKQQYRKFISFLIPFIKYPRAGGAEAVQAAPWRERAANMSRQIGERLLIIAFGLSCHGPVKMNAHLEAFGDLLVDTWNKDGLEQPLLYQCLGRLGILTPTDITELQNIMKKRISGLVPRGEVSKLERARFNAFLLGVCGGEEYPFPTAEGQLSRLWHWDENSPPLVEWKYLLPVLYALWIHHWIKGNNAGAVRDLAAMLGSWWDNHEPAEGYFSGQPETWEGILMTAWALVPKNNLVWNKLKERYNELEFEEQQLEDISEGYFKWHDSFVETGEVPPESFDGRRMPPASWLFPLPSDLLPEASRPSFDFPKTWLEELGKMESPDFDKIESY